MDPELEGDGLQEDEAALRRDLREWLPVTGDRMFVESPTAVSLDPLGFGFPGENHGHIGRWDLYAAGYLEAADAIVNGLGHQPWEDKLIYTVLMLYRHHLELQLKIVIRAAPGFLHDMSEWLYRQHDLIVLWHWVAEVYPGVHTWASAECREACERLIAELSNHDPRSTAARYPVERDGGQVLVGLRTVDLAVLRRGIHKISHYLDAILEGIHQDREWAAEVASW
jgi:hypothetical protein